MASVSTFVPAQAFLPDLARAELRNARSKPTLWPTITASPRNSNKVGRTCSTLGARSTIALVMPVKTVISGGMERPGSTNVWKVPKTSPPLYLIAPISVISSAFRLPPVVSKSITQNVTSRNGVPRSSRDC